MTNLLRNLCCLIYICERSLKNLGLAQTTNRCLQNNFSSTTFQPLFCCHCIFIGFSRQSWHFLKNDHLQFLQFTVAIGATAGLKRESFLTIGILLIIDCKGTPVTPHSPSHKTTKTKLERNISLE